VFDRIPEPEIMEDTEKCEYYHQSVINNSGQKNNFIKTYKNYIGIEHGTIIDLGSGCATFVIELCRNYPDLKVVCYEASTAMYNLACKNIANNKLEDRITIINDNFFNATGTFDAVICHKVLHHINNTELFWKVVQRLSANVLVWDLERPEYLRAIPTDWDSDSQNSWKAAYTVEEVASQIKEYKYNLLKEQIWPFLFVLTVYHKK